MEEYRVNLDKYNGPLDLLLYLIRREELDIYDIPIARITEQYVSYVDVLKQVDPNLAGEFLVMAASLLEIKTRMLLPSPPPEEGGPDEGLGDPRSELVRQLLEYKAFKDAAMDLREASEVHSQKFPRRPSDTDSDDEDAVEIEDVQVWDLFDSFSKILEAIGIRGRQHEVIYDDTPVELHEADILDRLTREGTMTFTRIFEGRSGVGELIGLFLALLELIRQRKIRCVQETNFAEIAVALRAAEDIPRLRRRRQCPGVHPRAGASPAPGARGRRTGRPGRGIRPAGRPGTGR
ncbi:MAG: segregation/condensation protein A [Planctomycetota bacterium]|nr:segregation/condensation protein A [Planctomycetota bacterium]